MQAQVAHLVLRSSFNDLRSPKTFIRTIMFARAIERHASSSQSENKKQSPLQLNPSAINTARPNPPPKRKLDRTMSTSSSLGSLHNQVFDENSTHAGVVDLTSSPPEKKSTITYPRIEDLDHLSYPSLPPLPRTELPSSSAPVPWSSSPDSHFNKPVSRPPPPPNDASAARPAKKRALPSSFTSAANTRQDGEYRWENRNNKEQYVVGTKKQPEYIQSSNTGLASTTRGRFDDFAAPKQRNAIERRDKGSSAVAQMLEKASSNRQKQTTSMSRTSSDKSLKSFMKPSETPKGPTDRIPETFLSDEQRAVVKAVMEEGKSVFFTGSAGTGKSVLMRAIIAQLRHKYRQEPDRIAVTASTGLASCILEGQTLHSWAGIGLGKEPAPELVKKIKRNMKSRQRWLRTKVLIIDEISMVDGQLFDKLEQIARTMRNNGRPFGGIQLVFTGDFFQLPPVPDRNTEARFVFDAVTWNTCIQHTILLTHVFRQKDEQFARMLNEMRLGKMSPETVREFKSLSRPMNFHDDLEATEL